MRRVLLAMSVAGVLVVAACSDDGPGEDEHAVAPDDLGSCDSHHRHDNLQ